ncbi:multiple inositol polyphosphate phosphatase 1-like [Amyelois transitella]|uniref:multiple inositol polyphosphate phosphatase 1-like n=1 Tax=Amyelois transitella TaxID=680683 RepID=UPI002990677A|nr:multiple inositol polyphosphate phosphatase 1-like [Amyelois transitella]
MKCLRINRSVLSLIPLINNVYCLSCFWNNYCPYRYFSTKTPYSNDRGDIRDVARLKGCEAISIWGLIRHGQLNPNKKYSDYIENVMSLRNEILLSHEKGKGSLCVQDLENLRNWKVNSTTITDKYGSTSNNGMSPMAAIAHRYKEAYKDLPWSLESTYIFKSNSLPYVLESIDEFVDGLKQPGLHINYSTLINVTMSKHRIEKRLGFTYDYITFLYDVCRWSAVDNKAGPWCALFDEEDLKIQEYREDLRLYYNQGYGNSWNEEFGQVTLADLLKTFRLEKERPDNKITLQFCRGPDLSMAYSGLGLFKDDTILTANFRDDNRKWRTSEHAPFNGNLVAVLHRCEKTADNYVVAFYMNESPLKAICNHGVCNWKEFEEMFRPFENKTFENSSSCFIKDYSL